MRRRGREEEEEEEEEEDYQRAYNITKSYELLVLQNVDGKSKQPNR